MDKRTLQMWRTVWSVGDFEMLVKIHFRFSFRNFRYKSEKFLSRLEINRFRIPSLLWRVRVLNEIYSQEKRKRLYQIERISNENRFARFIHFLKFPLSSPHIAWSVYFVISQHRSSTFQRLCYGHFLFIRKHKATNRAITSAQTEKHRQTVIRHKYYVTTVNTVVFQQRVFSSDAEEAFGPGVYVMYH